MIIVRKIVLKKEIEKRMDAINYSKRKGNHLSDIKRITNHGNELIGSPQCDSQDILNKMALYHDED